MTMNGLMTLGGDTLIVFLGVTLSFGAGALLRLGRSLARERREVDRARVELRELSERCDLQQTNVMRLGQQVEALRRDLKAVAKAQAAPPPAAPAAPVAIAQPAAVRAAPPPAPAPAPAPVRAAPRPDAPAVRRAPKPAPAKVAPRAQAPARSPSAFELARSGAGVQAIMRGCGLSRAEAELVLSVHGRSAA